MAKKLLKAKDIEALENTTIVVPQGLTGMETYGCPTLSTCNDTLNCPTIATCTTYTGACMAMNTLGTNCIVTTFTGLCL